MLTRGHGPAWSTALPLGLVTAFAVHATVADVERSEKLQMVGPLGQAGHAIHLVTTDDLEPLDPGRSRLTVTIQVAGEVHPGWDSVVLATWRHSIDDRFVPWVTAGKHREGS
jgi:hypothetical protein